MNYTPVKFYLCTAAATLWAFTSPALPVAATCTGMIVADGISAWMLSRRAARHLKSKCTAAQQKAAAGMQPGKFSSRKASRIFNSLIKCYAALLLAHGVDITIVPETASFSLMKFVGGAVCAWQLLSILENEASLNNAAWARIARRFLIDKASRHLGMKPEDFEAGI